MWALQRARSAAACVKPSIAEQLESGSLSGTDM